MPRITALLIAVVAAALAGVLVVTLVSRQNGPPPAPELPSGFHGAAEPMADPEAPQPGFEDWAMPEFELVDQTGAAMDASVLDGSWTVAAFVFTNCPFACPGMTSEMLYLATELSGTPTRYLAMSVDPVNDTPERLLEYAEELGVDQEVWTFGTGGAGVVSEIVQAALRVDLSVDENTTIPTKGGGEMFNIAHPTRLILVGPDRSIRGLYAYDNRQQMNELLERLRRIHAGG